jgi:hypothetical protein
MFSEEDWENIAAQYEKLYHGTAELITENKGSLPEAQEVYVESFIYYTQLLELHGHELMHQAEQIIYSFSRKIWIQKLRKRNVDVNFVKHRREFFEMEDAFHEIDAIRERSDKTASKLAAIGEPARTLILEYIGRGQELTQIAERLRFRDEDHAFIQLTKSLRRLIQKTEGKEFDLTDDEFAQNMRYVLDNKSRNSTHIEESHKVCVTMISRTVAMIRNYITRTDRMQHLRDLRLRIKPESIRANTPDSEIKKKMKPLSIISIAAVTALTISLVTSFTLVKNFPEDELDENIATQEQTIPETPETPVEEPVRIPQTAFALNDDGLLVTTAAAVKGKSSVILKNTDLEFDIEAAVMHVDTILNMAILKVHGDVPFRVSHRISPDDPKIGQAYFTLGFDEGQVLYAEGNLNSSGRDGIGKIKIGGGISGAPILSEKGQILGMIADQPAEGSTMTRVIYGSQMKNFIANWQETSQTEVNLPQRNGLFYSSREDQITKVTGCIFEVEEKGNTI